jgi:hypothetical protein
MGFPSSQVTHMLCYAANMSSIAGPILYQPKPHLALTQVTAGQGPPLLPQANVECHTRKEEACYKLLPIFTIYWHLN